MLPDPEAARRTADDRTKAIVLVSPNNPTGAIYPPKLLSQFFDSAAAIRCALIIDETYKDFRASGQPAHHLFQRERWDETFIHLYSFSKVFSLTGYRVGGLAASPRLVAEIEKVMDCVAICAPRIAQDAALFGLRNLGDWKRQKQADNAVRLNAFRDALSHPELRYELVSSGAFFGYLRHPFADEASFDVARRLARQHGLLVLPGAMFGPNQERYLRVAFANVDGDVMPEVAERLIESQSA